VYPTKYYLGYTESQNIALRHWGHLAFRGCTQKRYSPVSVYPTENIINTESQKIAPRHLGHLAFRGCTLERYSPVALYPTEKNGEDDLILPCSFWYLQQFLKYRGSKYLKDTPHFCGNIATTVLSKEDWIPSFNRRKKRKKRYFDPSQDVFGNRSTWQSFFQNSFF